MEVSKDFKFNVTLAKSRGLSEDDMYALNAIYEYMDKITNRPSMLCDSPKQAVEVVEALEITMQLLWQFPLDKSFHVYWFQLEGCLCPKMDNRERAGFSGKIITEGCPYHSYGERADSWDDRRFK